MDRHSDCGALPLRADFSLFHEMMQAKLLRKSAKLLLKRLKQSATSLHQKESYTLRRVLYLENMVCIRSLQEGKTGTPENCAKDPGIVQKTQAKRESGHKPRCLPIQLPKRVCQLFHAARSTVNQLRPSHQSYSTYGGYIRLSKRNHSRIVHHNGNKPLMNNIEKPSAFSTNQRDLRQSNVVCQRNSVTTIASYYRLFHSSIHGEMFQPINRLRKVALFSISCIKPI